MVSSINTPAIPIATQQKTEAMKDKSALGRMLEKSRDEQYNVFMKMFLAQVKNQNPDNPMSTHEMTQSVMSFFSAAEQAQTNKLLKQGNEFKVKEQMAAAKTYLNKEIVYEGNVLDFDGNPEEIQLTMPGNVKEAELVILDENLKRVKTFPLDTQAGTKKFTWDGLNDQNEMALKGIYYSKVMAVDPQDGTVDIPTILKGTVKQISYEDESGEFLLLVKDKIGVDVENIINVRKPASPEILDLSKTMQEQIKQYEELTKLLRSQLPPEHSSTSTPE